jgi:hypothetical protein
MIPTTCTSVESVAVWATEVLQNLYPNLEVIGALDDDGEPIKFFAVDSNKFFLTSVSPPEWRHLGSHSIKLKPEHQRGGKVWEHTYNLGEASVPAEMRV